jgi:hypothetical protein
MSAIRQLAGFYNAISDDHRIGTVHISLYLALFRAWLKNECRNPVLLERASIMHDAKIRARSTYNKCMRELNDYGYLKYQPSYNGNQRSVALVIPLTG